MNKIIDINQVKISIIIPYYNVKIEYFEKCIESIANQTFSEFEVIVIDDGSNEKYSYYLDTLKYRYKFRLSILHQRNQGVSAARNLGLKHAIGYTVCFIDADDYVASWMLEDLWHAYVSNDVIASAAYYKLTYNDNLSFIRYNKVKILNNLYMQNTSLKGMASKETNNGFLSAGPVAVLFSSKIAKTLEFDIEIRYMEDVIWNNMFFCHNGNVAVLDETVYAYRQIESSATHSFNSNMVKERIKAVNKVLKICHGDIEFLALRIFTNYINCCKCYVLSDEYQGLFKKIKMIYELNNLEEWNIFKKKGISSKWGLKQRIKLFLAKIGILPFYYLMKRSFNKWN